MFNDGYVQRPWDRSVTNGPRLATYGEEDMLAAGMPIEQPHRDFLAEDPVSDETYRVFLGMYAYDPALSAPEWPSCGSRCLIPAGQPNLSVERLMGRKPLGYNSTSRQGT